VNEILRPFGELLPAVVGTIVILAIGFFLASSLKSLAKSLMEKAKVDEYIGKLSKRPAEKPPRVTEFFASLVYYLVLLFVLMALLEFFHLTMLVDPIKLLLGSILVYGSRFFGAIVLLLIAWLVAKVLRMATQGLLTSLQVDEKFSQRLPNISLTKNLSDIVFGLVFLFFLPAILDALALQGLLGPVNVLITKILAFLPNLVGAGILLVIAWVTAEILRKIVVAALDTLQLNKFLGCIKEECSASQIVGNIVYGLVFLFFLPAILDALALGGLLAPVNGMVSKLLAFLPNLAAGLLILLVAWLLARFIRSFSFNLLRSSGIDEKVSSYMNQVSLAKTISDALYALTLLLFLPAVLDALTLQGLLAPINVMIEKILAFMPNLFAAVVLLFVAYICGRILTQFVSSVLASIGLDAFLAREGLISSEKKERQPSQIIGLLVFFWIMLLAVMQTTEVLGFAVLTDLSAKFTVFAAQILLGILVFAIGLYLANWAHRTIIASQTVNASLLAITARIAILILSAAMALREMGIANDIINLAFGLLLGAIAVAAALAFGLGGREVAQRHLSKWSECFHKEKKED